MKFFHAAFSFLKKVFTNVDWTHAAQVAITLGAPLAETLAQLLGGSQVNAEVTNIMNTIKTDFGVVSGTLTQIQQAPGNVNAVTLLRNTLANIKANLASLEQVADIKNADVKQEVTMTTNLLIGEIDAILASVPVPIPAAA